MTGWIRLRRKKVKHFLVNGRHNWPIFMMIRFDVYSFCSQFNDADNSEIKYLIIMR